MKVPEKFRITNEIAQKYHWLGRLILFVTDQSYENNGAFVIPRKGKETGVYFFCIASDGQGWDHVSVTIPAEKRCPTWEEMCYIKDLFFDAEECAYQLHPPAPEYVNNHEYCLHLWRSQQTSIPLPDSLMVGIN